MRWSSLARPAARWSRCPTTKLAEAGAIGGSERVVVVITGEGLKTLDAVRDGFELTEIEPSLTSFESAFAPAVTA